MRLLARDLAALHKKFERFERRIMESVESIKQVMQDAIEEEHAVLGVLKAFEAKLAGVETLAITASRVASHCRGQRQAHSN